VLKVGMVRSIRNLKVSTAAQQYLAGTIMQLRPADADWLRMRVIEIQCY
jgi:hypothetical protein